MSAGRALMPVARAFAGKATTEFPAASLGIASRDPLDGLLDRVHPLTVSSVDALQVAALLEASGVTDRVARARFGFTDVFDLAEELRRRVGPATGSDLAETPPPRTDAWRDIGHGAIYLMPVAVFPASMAVIGTAAATLKAVALTGAVSWVVGGAVAALAYRLLGDGHPASATRLLRWALLVAAPLGAAVAALAAAAFGAAPAVSLLGAAALTYQMAVTVLVIRRREAQVFAAIAPALIAGPAYLVLGSTLRPLAVTAGLASVACVLGLALRETSGGDPSSRLIAAIRSPGRGVLLVFAYTALSAAFFLYPQLPHLANRFDVILAVLPVVAGMGVVEWRAHRFSHDARALLSRVTHPRQFAARIWIVVIKGLCSCVAIVGVLAVGLLGLLAAAGRYADDVAAMAAAGVLLAAAYFLAFLLANLGRHAWLCASLLLGLGTYEVTRIMTPADLGDAHAFGIAAAALLVLHLIGLAAIVGDARRHR